MSKSAKEEQAQALIAALQTILDKLPDNAEAEEEADAEEDGERPIRNPTHELFVGSLDAGALAGLFTSIRIIHTIHNANR